MHDVLMDAYGPQHWWPARTRFEVVVGAYLTQNTAWSAVERSLRQLRSTGNLNIHRLRAIPVETLQDLIRPSGFATRKAPAIKAFIALLDRNFRGSLTMMAKAPTGFLREQLLALPGVGPETADAILLYALGHAVPVVDEYLHRVVERHGLLHPAITRGRKSYEALVQLTRNAFAADAEPGRAQLYNEFHALIVAVGKAHCSRTPDCARCPLAADLQRSASKSRATKKEGDPCKSRPPCAANQPNNF